PDQPASTVRFTPRGRDTCTVLVFGDAPDLLVHEIGRYSGEMTLAQGSTFIDIGASGPRTSARV
ncbi:MAG TPA: hypothetical protein VFH03_28190, partial [Actinoplanes sp.]|nr:hypothetical protein [Actinoplanes sp.]